MVSYLQLSTYDRPITQLETIRVVDMKPPDIGNSIRVRVYRKWTVTAARGARQPTLCFILLDQQVSQLFIAYLYTIFGIALYKSLYSLVEAAYLFVLV